MEDKLTLETERGDYACVCKREKFREETKTYGTCNIVISWEKLEVGKLILNVDGCVCRDNRKAGCAGGFA